MFNLFLRSIYLLVFTVLLIGEVNYAQDTFNESDVSKLAEKISTYEYGKDRAPLFEFNEILINSLNNDQNLDYLEDKLIEIITNASTMDGKRFACQLLSKVGTSNSIEPLVSLLKDKNTADMARFALEKIDTDEVDNRLLKIIDNTDGLAKIGIVNTLGARKSQKAIRVIAALAKSKDSKLSRTAISALGKIGGEESESNLKNLLKNSDGAVISNCADALLIVADNYLIKDELQNAGEIYQSVYTDERLSSQRIAALNGLILATQKSSERDGLIVSALMDNNQHIQQVGLSSIKKVSETKNGNSITENFNRFTDNIKINTLNRIKEERLTYYAEFVRTILTENSPQVQIAAIECLQSIGNADDVDLFLELAVGKKSQMKNASRNALYGIKGVKAEEIIINLVNSSSSKEQVELINAIRERQISSAFPTVYTAAMSNNQKVRVVSYRALGIISKFKDLEKLMNIFSKIEDTKELKPFENSLAKISLSHNKVNERATVFLSAIDEISEHEKKMSLLRILGATGDKNALNKIESYLDDDNEEVKKAAIQSLYNWPSIEPKDQLFDIIKNDDNKTNRILALRSYVNLLKEHGADDERITEYYKDVLVSSEELNELPLVISGIATNPTLESLEFATQFLDNPTIQSETELAILNIIEGGGWDFPNQSLVALEKLIEKSADEDIIRRAKDILEEIKNEL